jgi:hypothetical protein
MKKRISACFSLLILLGSCFPAVAQDNANSQSATPAAAPSPRDTQEKNIQEYIELLRSDVRHQKAEIMGAVMALDVDQAAKFWPIYSEYDSQLTKLNDQRLANIQDYARNYDQMTDARANELVQSAFNYRKHRSELVAKYYGRIKDSLGAVEAARFVLIESQLLEIIDLQIASSLPIVEQGS